MRRYKEERKPPSEGVLDLEGRKSKGDGDAQDTRRRVGLERCARRKMLGRAWTPLRESGGGGGMETDARRIEGRRGCERPPLARDLGGPREDGGLVEEARKPGARVRDAGAPTEIGSCGH